MRNLRVRRPSAGLAVSVVALMVALGGTSYAAITLPQNSVGTAQLKNGAIATAKIRNGAVTGAKINLSSLGTVASAKHAYSANVANAAYTANTANTASTANTANTAKFATTAGGLPALTWTNLTLQNGAVRFGTSYGTPSYTKDAEGFVHLNGAVDLSATKGAFAVLPMGFRPQSHNSWMPTAATNGAGDPHLVEVTIDHVTGALSFVLGPGSTGKFVDLEGISFYAG
jgi:hypothetical protein